MVYILKLFAGLGVPPSCLADFFEAVDRHMQRLEGDLSFHLGQESKAHGSIDYFKQQLANEGSTQLKVSKACKHQFRGLQTMARFSRSYGNEKMLKLSKYLKM